VDRLVAEGRLAEAEKACRELVRKDDARAGLHRGNLARVLCLRGDEALRRAGFFDRDAARSEKAKEHPAFAEAAEFFKAAEGEAQAAVEKPGSLGRAELTVARSALGLAAYRQGKVREAAEELRRAIADGAVAGDGRSAGALNTLGLIYHETGRRAEALTCFLAALQADPGLSEAAYNLAVYFEDEAAELDAEEARARAERREVAADLAGRRIAARREALRYYARCARDAKGRSPAAEEARGRLAKLEAEVPAGERPGGGAGGTGQGHR
jgi:tetratricopeptide (TPR) repeat protein